MALTDVTHDAQDFVPPAEVAEEELYHPKTWLGKYVFSQDAKIIALQYSITAMGVGLLALVLSVLMRDDFRVLGENVFSEPSFRVIQLLLCYLCWWNKILRIMCDVS
jgi:cytochrome c oxidase subunit 1